MINQWAVLPNETVPPWGNLLFAIGELTGNTLRHIRTVILPFYTYVVKQQRTSMPGHRMTTTATTYVLLHDLV